VTVFHILSCAVVCAVVQSCGHVFVSLPVRTDVFKYSFFLRPLPIGIPSHWLFVSCSWPSPSAGLCRTPHPPTVADYHDTPAVTGGLHPLLDIAPKHRSRDIPVCNLTRYTNILRCAIRNWQVARKSQWHTSLGHISFSVSGRSNHMSALYHFSFIHISSVLIHRENYQI